MEYKVLRNFQSWEVTYAAMVHIQATYPTFGHIDVELLEKL
jgi:hypothetical protein